MSESTNLPPGCTVRCAQPQDRLSIIKLMFVSLTGSGNYILNTNIFIAFTLLVFTLTGNFLIGILIDFNIQNFLVLNLLLFVATKPTHGKINLFISSSKLRFWLVECNELIVGYGLTSECHTYTTIKILYILPAYRSQKLGSILLSYIIENTNKPLYLFCRAKLISFYQRFGFESTSRKQLPLDLEFSFLPALVLNKSSILISPPIQTDTLPADRIIRRAKKRDRTKIRQFIFTSSALDFFLPFGITSSLASSLMILLFILFPVFLIMLSTIKVVTNLSIPIVGLLAVGILVILVLPVYTLVSAYFQMQNWAQFYLVESNNKLIAYARLSRHNQYSILHYLHFCFESNLSRQQLTKEILQYSIEQVHRPIYLACEAEALSFYKHFGFITIATSKLPSSLQLGANLNCKFGGVNLVLK